ncbi:MAG: glutamate racemase [Kiritimatiellae bacterium]|nr:glutamate racemase [Kiritimatiellia bacterium]
MTAINNIELVSKNKNPSLVHRVGFFDSGIDGLSVVHAFQKLCDDAEIFYVADWTYCPYGDKPINVIQERARVNTKSLIEQGCTTIVVACNTATAAAIDILRKEFPEISFVGMEPAIKPAASQTKSGVVGVLATNATFKGRLFRETCAKYSSGIEVLEAVGEGFVELVEQGKENSEEAFECVSKVVQPLLNKGADCLVLGCTHYPFLKKTIQAIVGSNVSIIDPSDAVAQQIIRVLQK